MRANNALISACTVKQVTGRRMPGTHTGPKAGGGNPVRPVQGPRGLLMWQRRRAAACGQSRRHVEGRALALPVVRRDSVGGYPGLVADGPFRPRARSRGPSPALLRLGGQLRAVVLGPEGAPQEESHAITAPRPRSRQPKQLDAGIFQAEISSFALRLAAE